MTFHDGGDSGSCRNEQVSGTTRLATLLFTAAVFLIAAFMAGAWFGSRDRLCVTAPANGTTIVWCAHGTPKGRLEQ